MEIIKNGFKNERLGIELDVYVIGGKEWFKDSDIAKFLDYRDSYNMKRSISFLNENSIPRFTRNGYEAHFINEYALYECVLKIKDSDKDNIKHQRFLKAREFQKWVFEEVLPSLRKNNFYINKNQITKEQVDLLKECLFDLCEDGKIALGKASMRIFGDKSELKKRLINSGFLDYDNCTWKQRRFRASNGEIYELFACNVSTVVEKGLAKSTLQVSLTNAGYIWLKDRINKDKDFGRGDDVNID